MAAASLAMAPADDGVWLLDLATGAERLVFSLAAGIQYDLARLASPPPFNHGPLRCDLHPRWSPDGRKICIDSAHAGSRQMFILPVDDLTG